MPPSCGDVGAAGVLAVEGAVEPNADGAVLPNAGDEVPSNAGDAVLPNAEGDTAPVLELGVKLLVPNPDCVVGFATFDPVSVHPAAWTPEVG